MISCSLRIGEILGLTWDCVDISPESMASRKTSVYINKEIQRCNRDALEKPDDKDVILKFPAAISNTHTIEPLYSGRKIWEQKRGNLTPKLQGGNFTFYTKKPPKP